MALLTDGFPTLITFPGAGVTFAEKEVTPPGLKGGGPNDTTTMRQTAWRTRQPKKLKTMDTMSIKAAYDPAFLATTVAQINVNQLIILTHADGHTWSFWGYMDEFVPDQVKEGEQPTAEIKIVCTNQNNAGAEVAPVYA